MSTHLCNEPDCRRCAWPQPALPDGWLSNVRARFDLARMAGEDAEAHQEPWTRDPRFCAIVRSWQDIADLHDALLRCKREHYAGRHRG